MTDTAIFKCPSCQRSRRLKKNTIKQYQYTSRSGICRCCWTTKSRRIDMEYLSSGAVVDWSKSKEPVSDSAKNNFHRRISIQCKKCKKWRYINSCSLTEIRRGKQAVCWDCHKKEVAQRNMIGISGRRKNKQGYIIRSLCSFSNTELKLLKPMLRSGGGKSRKNKTEVLEHRAIVTIHLGRVLTKNDIVHHINGVKDDNRIENLSLHTIGQHSKEHHKILAENKRLKQENEILERLLNDKNNTKTTPYPLLER